MDITQLVSTVVALVGVALVGAMAVLPTVMEAAAARDEPRPAGGRPVRRAPAPLAPRRRHRPRWLHLA